MRHFYLFVFVLKCDRLKGRPCAVVRGWELSHWVTRSWVRSSLSADFAGEGLPQFFPSPDPTHVGASGTRAALLLKCDGLLFTHLMIHSFLFFEKIFLNYYYVNSWREINFLFFIRIGIAHIFMTHDSLFLSHIISSVDWALLCSICWWGCLRWSQTIQQRSWV